MDVAWMLARRPLQWQSSLLRGAMGNIEPADLIKISLYSGWLYLSNYDEFYVVCFAIRKILTIISVLISQWFSHKPPLLKSALDKLWW